MHINLSIILYLHYIRGYLGLSTTTDDQPHTSRVLLDLSRNNINSNNSTDTTAITSTTTRINLKSTMTMYMNPVADSITTTCANKKILHNTLQISGKPCITYMISTLWSLTIFIPK